MKSGPSFPICSPHESVFVEELCHRQGGTGFALLDGTIPRYHGSMEPTAIPPTNQLVEPAPVPPADRVRIISTPGTCGGKPRIDAHRITVEDVAIWHERMGMSPDEIVSAHPSSTLSDVHAALAYYYEHRERIDTDIREGEQFVEELKAKAPPSLLQEKLKQRNAKNDPILPR